MRSRTIRPFRLCWLIIDLLFTIGGNIIEAKTWMNRVSYGRRSRFSLCSGKRENDTQQCEAIKPSGSFWIKWSASFVSWVEI